MKYNTAFWVEGIQNLHEALRKAHDAGALPREAYPILHACAEALRYNGQASLAADILADEASLGVERHIDHKLEWARQKILALFECGTPEAVAEGTELVEYYAARLYLFPHMERAGFFLFFQCLLALRAQKPNLLQHAAAILADTEAGVRDAYFLRVTHQAGGLKKLLHLLPDLPLGTRATMAVGWSSQVLGGYGPFAAMLCRGLHSGLTLFRKLGKVMGKSQLNLLPCRGTPSPLPEHRLPILVTRAMGGIGDIMMMTPGLRALARKYPNREIHFALPKAFHPLLENNPDVVVKDIHGEPFYREDYVAVYNLTECPASRVESASLPGVRRNRIEIFAKAMGIKFNTLKKSGTRPVYRVSDEERIWAQAFFDENGLEPEKCVAVQPYAEDSYRNWSGIENFSLQLANDKYVLVFHGKKLYGFNHNRIFKIDNVPLRKAIALLLLCSRLFCVDSAFMHIAAALGKETTILFGPIDGEVRTKYYSECIVINGYKQTECRACWRNQGIVCAKTLHIESGCIENISAINFINRIDFSKQK